MNFIFVVGFSLFWLYMGAPYGPAWALILGALGFFLATGIVNWLEKQK
jgi:hypothetical protein